jgi:hypothetical protein
MAYHFDWEGFSGLIMNMDNATGLWDFRGSNLNPGLIFSANPLDEEFNIATSFLFAM